MHCDVCRTTTEEHRRECPHEKPADSLERKEYVRGIGDGLLRDVVTRPNDWYLLGYQAAVLD